MKRSLSLDLVRATAILLVLVHHVNAMAPGAADWTRRVTNLGAFGVDLFFVLSGWLVGSLYWGELASSGDVRAGRFVLARMARTIPPYFVVLPLAWGGVMLQRGQPFDWSYLFFAQNFRSEIPFFFVSWSLCVEEHFYLLLPILLLPIRRSNRRIDLFFAAAILIPTILRWRVSAEAQGAPFGYYKTATQLRCEGLLLGVWLSHWARRRPEALGSLSRLGRLALVPTGVLFVWLGWSEDPWSYTFGSLAAGLFFAALLTTLLGTNLAPSPWVASTISGLSSSAYSIYLTHSLVIQAVLIFLRRLGLLSRSTFTLTAIVSIFVASTACYLLVERPVLRLRRRLFPSPNRELRLTALAPLEGGAPPDPAPAALSASGQGGSR